MKLTRLFIEFFESEKAGGLLLIICTFISLLFANSVFGESYSAIWNYSFADHSLVHWINDGLMAIFFLMIGLELEREIYTGELSSLKNASLPIVAAMGGMVIPAGIFYILNYSLPTQTGIGIPMATDIAFAIGLLSLLGNRVPVSLKILLMALAVIDDLGAIIIIAIFYTTTLSFLNLAIALSFFVVLLLLNRLKVTNLLYYLFGGVAMWYFMLHSGVHATISGVLVAFAIPFGDGNEKSISFRLQHYLHKPVAFFILPLFALANTCILIDGNWYKDLSQPGSLGILAGLIAGKPLGIFIFSYLAVSTGICILPSDVKWKHIAGIGFLGGIGFTMSIFITLLAYDVQALVVSSKFAIMIASLIAAIIGYVWLSFSLRKKQA